jgi:hypothetical protein
MEKEVYARKREQLILATAEEPVEQQFNTLNAHIFI